MNEIGTLDVSNQPDLEFLDCSYCDLEELYVADCPKLTTLNAYGNYISSIDLSNQKDLVNIDLKGNMISEMHLGACDKVEKLSLQGNSFTAIDVTGMPLLKELNVALNQLTELNTSNNSQLEVLSANGNQLTKLDLSNNPKLRSLLLNGNKLAGLDLRNQKELSLIYVSDNGWDACTLNDFYYSLNEWKEVQSSYGTGNTLWVADNNATNNNDAEHSETTIATAKGWRVNSDGDGSGCNQAYVTILDTENGTVGLFTNDNNEVRSGDKVEKNSVLTLQATPDEGYELSTAKANGRSIADNKFTVIRATDVMVKFTVATSVSGVAGGNVTVESGNHELIFTAATETEAAIYTLDGSQVFCGKVAGKYAVSLPAGIYAVRIGSTTKKIMVK
uniref:leucine-rich repeat domain-containing protein n=1 Tax=Prevotella sp. TaxID=59823 RepID=UPI003FEE594A